jgi:hypothetical protein
MKKDCGKQGCPSDHPGQGTRPWRRGDRMSATSANGTFRTWPRWPTMSAVGGVQRKSSLDSLQSSRGGSTPWSQVRKILRTRMMIVNEGPLLAQSGRFASEPEAVRWTVHSDLNRLPTAGRLWCAYVAPRVSVDCYSPIAAAGRRAGCAGSLTPPSTTVPFCAESKKMCRVISGERSNQFGSSNVPS